VNENSITRLDGNVKSDEFAADISGKKFVDKSNLLKDLLGREVIVATHKSDENSIILAWQTYKDETVELTDSVLLSTVSDIAGGTVIAETENGGEKKYALDKDVVVVSNGYENSYWTAEDLVVDGGSLKLVNNDKDSAYDVVFVDKYSLHYVTGVVSDDENVTVIDRDDNQMVVDKATLRITDPAGKTLSASKIKKDALVKFFATESGENARFVVYSSPVTGKLESKYSEGFVIDGEAYTMSVYYKNHRPADEPGIGNNVKAFVEENGEILFMEAYSAGSSDWVTAFSQATGSDGILETTTRIKVFDEKGVWNIYETAEKVRVDGVMMSRNELAETLANAKNSGNWIYEKAFIRYKLNSDRQIREIDTTVENEDSEFKLMGNIASGLYSRESNAFWLEHKQIALVKNDTPVFVIPVVGGQYTTDTEFDDLYSVSANVTNVAGNRSSQAQNLDMYMPDEFGMPTFLAQKKNYAASTGGITAVTSDSAPNIVVEEVEAQISDSEIVYNVKGKDLSTLADVSFIAEESIKVLEAGILYQEKFGTTCFGSRGIIQVGEVNNLPDEEKARYISGISELGAGDIVRFETLGTKARAVERIFDYEPSGMPDVKLTAADVNPVTWFAANGTYPEHYIAFNRFQLGDIEDVTANTFTLRSLKGHKENYIKNSLAKIYSVSGGRSFALEEEDDLYKFTDGNYKAVVFSYNASPKTVVVYEFEK